jgi:hypothetical protein
MKLLSLVGFLCMIAVAAAGESGQTPTESQLNARYYFDLGPDKIDVSAYPEAQQKAYPLFEKTCSKCHSLSRAINSPFTTREDWKRFLTRMHERKKALGGPGFMQNEGRTILDFLAFDSQERKVKRKDEFAKSTLELKALFEQTLKEREKLQKASDKKTAEGRERAPFTGVK